MWLTYLSIQFVIAAIFRTPAGITREAFAYFLGFCVLKRTFFTGAAQSVSTKSTFSDRVRHRWTFVTLGTNCVLCCRTVLNHIFSISTRSTGYGQVQNKVDQLVANGHKKSIMKIYYLHKIDPDKEYRKVVRIAALCIVDMICKLCRHLMSSSLLHKCHKDILHNLKIINRIVINIIGTNKKLF